jgi:hypothetical protein
VDIHHSENDIFGVHKDMKSVERIPRLQGQAEIKGRPEKTDYGDATPEKCGIVNDKEQVFTKYWGIKSSKCFYMEYALFDKQL